MAPIVDIPAWIAEQRAVCQVQLRRWDGVDPTRLLQALDLIEQLLSKNVADTSGASFTLMRARTKPRLPSVRNAAMDVLIEGILPSASFAAAREWEQRVEALGTNVAIVRRSR